ncbi:MAG: hypothetical protein ABI551_20970, partial [Polyangiaceae bacterium]
MCAVVLGGSYALAQQAAPIGTVAQASPPTLPRGPGVVLRRNGGPAPVTAGAAATTRAASPAVGGAATPAAPAAGGATTPAAADSSGTTAGGKASADTDKLPQFEQATEYEPRSPNYKVSFSLEDADLNELVRVIGQLT